jgi:hypothetical protein
MKGPGIPGAALLLVLALGQTVPAFATGITYTCDPNIDATQAGTCAYLNSAIAGIYNSTFSNANASIYVDYGTTGLGESTTGSYNEVSYSAYLNALSNNPNKDTIDVDALAALNNLDTAIYGSGSVEITSALGQALGFSSMIGTTADGDECFHPGTGGCYNGIITITTPANLSSETSGSQTLYYRQNGGTQPSNAYDFYSVVEHETDEVLGTASCIVTTTTALSDPCPLSGTGTPSAVDLFRYSSVDALIPDSAPSTTSGAYFSYDGGATNGAAGAIYNTMDNGKDYADFVQNCGQIQDEDGCLGGRLDIDTDGGAEINILNAVGFNVNAPEPGTTGMLGLGLALGIGAYRRRRSAANAACTIPLEEAKPY